jgi:hypothetical protein
MQSSDYCERMAKLEPTRDALGETLYPPEVAEALKAVDELPDDPEAQAEYFDKVQDALSTRLREES